MVVTQGCSKGGIASGCGWGYSGAEEVEQWRLLCCVYVCLLGVEGGKT